MKLSYVTVFGRPESCPICGALVAYFTEANIPHHIHDVSRDVTAGAALKDAGFTALPQAFDQRGHDIGSGSDLLALIAPQCGPKGGPV